MIDSPIQKSTWAKVKFGDVVRLNTDRVADPQAAGIERYVGLEHITPEDLHIHSWGLVAEGTTFTNLSEPGQVLFGKRRAYQRKVAVADFEGVCSGDIYVFETKDHSVLLPDLLPFLCQTEGFFQHAVGTSAGSLSPRTNWQQLAGYEFPLPPLDEQRRIADVLWSIDIVRNSYQVLLTKLVNCKKGALSRVFQYGLGHYEFSETELGKLPNSWKVLPLGNVCEFLDHKRIPLSTTERAKRKGSFPYYGASGIIDYIDGFIFDEPLILLGEDGANIVDRSTPLAFKVSGKIWVNNHAHVLRVSKEFNVDYIVEYLESISYEKYRTGSAQPKLNKENVARIPIPVPSIEEQDKIANSLNCLNSMFEITLDRIKILKTFKSNLLNKI